MYFNIIDSPACNLKSDPFFHPVFQVKLGFLVFLQHATPYSLSTSSSLTYHPNNIGEGHDYQLHIKKLSPPKCNITILNTQTCLLDNSQGTVMFQGVCQFESRSVSHASVCQTQCLQVCVVCECFKQLSKLLFRDILCQEM